jgi:alpha-ketoglutarate-dependent taurine dioxygenase
MFVMPLSTHRQRLLDVEPKPVIRSLADAGVILFRGFACDLDEFVRFTLSFGAPRVSSSAPRYGTIVEYGTATANRKGKGVRRTLVPDSKDSWHVNVGNYGISFHAEAYSEPTTPDIIWFYCRAIDRREDSWMPNSAGRTGLRDGVDVVRRLQPRTRSLLADFEKAYHIRPELAVATPGMPGRLATKLVNGMTEHEYIVPALRKPRFNDELAFANFLLLDQPGPPFPGVSYEWSELHRQIPLDCAHDLVRTVYSGAEWHDWEAGDVLMIDNTRMMHAREPFPPGDLRDIVVRMTSHCAIEP